MPHPSAKFLHLTLATVVVFGSLIASIVWAGISERGGSLPLVLFLSACSGAVINNYRRFSAIASRSNDLEVALKNPMVSFQFYLSPLVGGIFGLLLWMSFFGGMIQGSLFPTIDGIDKPYTNFFNLMAHTRPASYSDAAKGIVWSFLAGYSERFVPNILDRLAEERDAQRQQSDRTTPTVMELPTPQTRHSVIAKTPMGHE